MTTTSPPDTESASTTSDPPSGRSHAVRPLTVAVLAGLVALACAALMPLLPVQVNEPVVTWPAVPGDPQPTALQLTTQRPLTLAAEFGCDTARRAAVTPDGLVLATMAPQSPQFGALALAASVRGDVLTVTSRGAPLYTGSLPAGNCRVTVDGSLTAVTARIDGAVVGTAPGQALPDVDVLTTSVRGPSDLGVRLTVDDQFATSPTPLKTAVAVLLVVALVVAVGALARRDRAVVPPLRGPAVRRRPAIVDVVVPLVIAAWAFLAPMTDDDGYYAAMAGNVPFAGYVANYYQLYNQSFTPFTWIYYALSGWQSAFGSSPVLLRIPALVLGVLTWFALRALVAKAWLGTESSPRGGWARRAVLAVAFLAWWLPFDMGVRAEAVIALTSVVSLLCVSAAVERGRWSLAALGVAAGAFGFTAAPTGFVALAPLVAAAPSVWRAVRAHLPAGRALLALVTIVAPGALIGLLAFGDGSLRDFARAQQIFLGMQTQEAWYSEITRWSFLLASDDAMANYAKRAPVLVGIAAIVCFLLLVMAGRRFGPVPPRLLLVGWSTILGFALLWFTPSKWTHHFGALAGVGPALIALLVVAGPLLARSAGQRLGVRWPSLVGAGVALAIVFALASHGTNRWPYSWMLGIPHAGTPPQVWIVAFDQPVWWLLGMLVVGAAVVLAARRVPSLASWRTAAPVLALSTAVTVFLAVTTTYMVGGFAAAAVLTGNTWSPWADAVADPLGRHGVAAAEMEVLDPASAVPLAPAVPGPVSPSSAFVPGGFFPSSPPPTPAVESWGSFGSPGGTDGPESAVGRFTSPWYVLGTPSPDTDPTISVSGRTGEGNELRVEYGRPVPDGVGAELVGSQVVGVAEDDAAVDSPSWRPVRLDGADAPPPGATLVRVGAVDASTSSGGWLAFTAPSTQRWTSVHDFLPSDRTVAVTWQVAFLFPGLHKPTQGQGINEPSTAAVMWGTSPLAVDSENVYAVPRGGLFAQSLRESAVVELPTRLRHFPTAGAGQVYLFRPYLPVGDAYRLDPASREVWGFTPAPNTTFSTPVDPG